MSIASTVLYGGTFNPVHCGHTALCRYLLSSGEYDRILVMPAASPPHKAAPLLAEAGHRMAMLRLAFGDMAGVELDDWELARGGKSYTVDTILYLRQRFPEDRLFLLMGSDMFLSFCQWRQWQEIGRQATLLVASRFCDDRAALERQQAKLTEQGIQAHIMQNPVVEVSSTEIRESLGQNGSPSQLNPKVLQYCKDNCLYRESYDLAQLRGIIRPLLDDFRYHHSLCVAEKAGELARQYGCDENKAMAAGLLHDICKNRPNEALLQIMQNCGIIYNIDFSALPQLLHSFAGAEYIRQQLAITDADLLNAVRYHTSARADMSLLERIVYLADLSSADRTYPDADWLRGLTNSDLQAAMGYALQYITADLSHKGYAPCIYTQQALAAYGPYYKPQP